MKRTRCTSALDWEAAKLRLAAANLAERQPDPSEVQRVLHERAAALARVPARATAWQASLELLQFTLGEERCAIETCYVSEVIRPSELTRVPGAPAHMLGIINLRGDLLPVFDLRKLLNAALHERSEHTRVLVLGRQGPEACILADSVHEIAQVIASAIILQAPALGSARDYLRGVTRDALVVFDAAALLDGSQMRIGDAEASITQEG
jgi:purine-binding chemotaxis protein CheW